MNTKLITTCVLMGALLTPFLGYSADSDTDRSHPGTFVKDSAITAKIKAKLAADSMASAIHVSVDTDKNGVVWLSGTARTQEQIDQAGTIARNTEKVKQVHNNIKIKNDE